MVTGDFEKDYQVPFDQDLFLIYAASKSSPSFVRHYTYGWF